MFRNALTAVIFGLVLLVAMIQFYDEALASQPIELMGFEVDGQLTDLRRDVNLNIQPIKPKKGMMVTDVINGSLADEAGLKEGDIIWSVNGHVIDSFEVMTKQATKMNAVTGMEFGVLRGGRIKLITLLPSFDVVRYQDTNIIYLFMDRSNAYAKRTRICGIIVESWKTRDTSFSHVLGIIFRKDRIGARTITRIMWIIKFESGEVSKVQF